MKRVLSILAAVFLTANMFGQATQEMSYQAVKKNNSNVLLTSSAVGMRGGTPVTAAIADPTGGNNYTAKIGTSELSSVPYALEATHYVGESYGGGIVFYVYDSGKHGIVTSTMDRSKRIQRQNGTSTVTNTVTNRIDGSKINTKGISASEDAEKDDVQIYSSYQDSYYSDWYLPSKYELSLLYLNRAVLGGYTNFAKGWSTTEDSRVNAWFKSFATGGSFSNGKDDVVYIRVHRRF